MVLRYSRPKEIEAVEASGRPLLTTTEGGRVVVDDRLRALWQFADGRTLVEILSGFEVQGSSEGVVRAALSCLVEGGLLQREADSLSDPESLITSETTRKAATVSVIVVSYKSRTWLEECIPSLRQQMHRPIEIVVVDNGCLDDTASWLAKNFQPEEGFILRLVNVENPVSFARASNLGADAASGDYFLMLNPDVRVDPRAIDEAVRTAQANRGGIVALKLRFWWAPAFLNGVGNRVGAFSWGTDNALGHLDLGQFDRWEQVPSACFAAALISRETWEAVGSADERFPMYYEDSEWSYRARLLGYPVYLAPGALVYHAFGGKVPGGDDEGLTARKLRNVVYGRMRFALKLVGRRLGTFLRNYWLEDFANLLRMLLRRDLDSARAYLGAWRDVLRDLPEIRASRKQLQLLRNISDEDLFRLPPYMPATFAWHGLPELTWDLIQTHYYPLIRHGKTKRMPEFTYPNGRPHLLIVSNDVVNAKMAGPGMRYLEMARALSADLDVTLAIPGAIDPAFAEVIQSPHLHVAQYDEARAGSLKVLVDNADVAVISGWMVQKFPFLDLTSTRLVVDLYDPFVLENLHYYLHEPLKNQQAMNEQAVAITNHLAKLGDFFICGNERQRDYWLGVLTANGRTNPPNFIQDPTMTSLIDIVSIGFPERPPRTGKGLCGVHPAIPEGSRIVLWGGGVWNWLDPLTLIQAWPKVVSKHPEARLVFLGTRHPNPTVPQHEMAQKAIRLAEETGEKDKTIIFIEWVSYEEREALLCEAAIGVTLHPIHVETRFSLRTRVLDCFWADLPVLITDGDITSEWIREYGLGEVVPPHDPAAVSQALLRILAKSKDAWQTAFAPLKKHMTWQAVVAPLRRYCLEGGYAPDRDGRTPADEIGQATTLSWAVSRLVYLMRTGGWKTVLHRGWRFIQWKFGSLK